MKRRRLLLSFLVLAAGLLVALAIWLRLSAEQGPPDAEALVGKWIRADAENSDLSITLYRSGECELSVTANVNGKPERVKAAGVWALQRQSLTLKFDTANRAWFLPEEFQWDIHLRGNRLTYKSSGSNTSEESILRRIPLPPGQSLDSLIPASFVGPSGKLKRTVVVPTLETPLPSGKSVIWCATLALAWKRLNKEVGKGPLVLDSAEEVAQALGRLPDVSLLPEHYYVTAGPNETGTRDRIRREMRARFPRAPVPNLPAGGPNGFLAFAHLETSVRYQFAFRDSEQPLRFKDSRGRVTPVKVFGIREQDEDSGAKSFRGQVRVLFREGEEFAVDLSRKTQPYQIVLARMPRKATLQATLADLERRVARSPRKGRSPNLGDGAILLIPNMNWRIEHRFRELENKPIRHPSLPPGSVLDTAFQLIQFKMDRYGTGLVSEALLHSWADGAEQEDFRFDRPYLILLRRRGVRVPFFVMWVANAELLQPR